jgi:beta-lactamase regulating signal transducer with metallopeptidase domain
MILEKLSLFYTGYIYSIFALVPLILFYGFVCYKNLPVNWLMGIHKGLLILSICLPIFMLASANSKLIAAKTPVFPLQTLLEKNENPVPSLGQESQTQSRESAILPLDSADWKVYPSLQDIVFYLSDILALLSIIGVIVFCTRLAYQHFRLRKAAKNGTSTYVKSGVWFVRTAAIQSPFSVGILRHRVFMPVELSPEQEKVVELHELNHFALNHHLWAFLETLQAHVFWFNPLHHAMVKRGILCREMECDKKTVQNVDKFVYSRVLLELAEFITPADEKNMSAHHLINKSMLKSRLDAILNGTAAVQKWIVALAAFLSVATCSAILIYVGTVNDEFLEQEVLRSINQKYAQTQANTDSIDIAKTPISVVNALILHEDGGFMHHDGLSGAGIIRATTHNIQSFISGGAFLTSGGSTITQQLAKSFLNEEKSLNRKVKELKVAHVLETNFNKTQILEMYLNRVYFGNKAWGLSKASQVYFDKPYTELTKENAAMLIPFLSGPTVYNLIKNSTLAAKRQKNLLNRLAVAGL